MDEKRIKMTKMRAGNKIHLQEIEPYSIHSQESLAALFPTILSGPLRDRKIFAGTVENPAAPAFAVFEGWEFLLLGGE